jgi:dihydrofolate reductase
VGSELCIRYSVTTAGTRLEREFDPAAIRQLKETADRDIGIGGPELAARALDAGLVDECHMVLVPVVVGSGKAALQTGSLFRLKLLEQRRFDSGVVNLRYAVGGT